MAEMIAALIHLDGYGKFVWPSYLITVLCMALDAWLAQRQLNRMQGGRQDDNLDNW